MWRLTKKNKALKNWHSKAMLVDPKKTKITIVGVGASNMNDDSENMEFVCEIRETPVAVLNAEGLNVDDCAERTDVADETLATPVSFVLVDP